MDKSKIVIEKYWESISDNKKHISEVFKSVGGFINNEHNLNIEINKDLSLGEAIAALHEIVDIMARAHQSIYDGLLENDLDCIDNECEDCQEFLKEVDDEIEQLDFKDDLKKEFEIEFEEDKGGSDWLKQMYEAPPYEKED